MPRVHRIGPMLIVALAATCTQAPAPPAVQDPPPETAVAAVASAEAEMAPPEELPVDPVDAALSAAAGLPQELAAPLAEGLLLGFDYGTLLDVVGKEGSGRQVLIEPIGLPVEEAVARIERDLRSAGFEPVAADAEAQPGQRRFRRHPAQGPDETLSLEATPYPDPESAAHPGGTGVIALRLEARDGRG